MVLQLYNLLACKVSCKVISRFLLPQLQFRFLQDRQTKICDSNGGSDTSDFPPCPKCVKGPSKWYDKQLNVVADTYTDVYCRVRKYLINGECNRFQLIAAQCSAFPNEYYYNSCLQNAVQQSVVQSDFKTVSCSWPKFMSLYRIINATVFLHIIVIRKGFFRFSKEVINLSMCN